MNLQPLLLPSAAIAAFVALWYALGSVAGILWTPRALLIGCGATVALYLLANLAYVVTLPLHSFPGLQKPPASVAT